MSEPNGAAVPDGDAAPNPQPAPPDPTNAQNPTGSTDPKSDAAGEAPGSRKPRDARIIHLILASMGVTSYQERVPLMLMDFAYRYTSSVLQDALLISDTTTTNNTANTGGANPPANITTDDLQLSVASRINHQFNSSLSKEFLLEIAQERNKIALPPIAKDFGVRLPPEKYCLTGVNWDLSETQEDWMEGGDDDEEEEDEPLEPPTAPVEGPDGVDEMDEDDFVDEGDGQAEDRLMMDASG